ncbi:hypothetical protein CERSUDRAFT_145802, partial [Gelatoporia subvermispora B]
MPGTRVQLLDEVQSWVRESNGSRIFWLDGMAGTGKSAIARSVCKDLDAIADQRLGGSFFCSRGTRDDVKRIIPTLAKSLARQDPLYRLALLDVLVENENVGYARLELQVRHLLEEPLRNAYGTKTSKWVLVMDALDECLDGDATKDMLTQLIARSRDIPVKLFVTSRPEAHIRDQFVSTGSNVSNIIRLHDIEQHIIESDIRLYIVERLKHIHSTWETRDVFPSKWPSDEDVTLLTKQAGKLFIYAFTIIKYIEENDPIERLKDLTQLGFVPEQPLTMTLDATYSIIVRNALDLTKYNKAEVKGVKEILAIVLAMRDTLSVCTLGELVGIPAQKIRTRLQRLHAVVYIPPQDESGTITTFHASFEDYLTTPGRAPEEYQIKTSVGHQALTGACIKTMTSDALHFNIANCRTSYLPNSKQDLAPVSTILEYSCIHWPHHLTSASNSSEIYVSLESILREKLLFWIEVVLSVGGVQLVSSLLGQAMTAAAMPQFLAQLLRDARTFVTLCQNTMDISIPHMYLSALPSEPYSSRIAQVFWPKFRNVAEIQAAGVSRRRKQYLHIEHTSGVTSVAFSPDRTRIVSGSWESTIRLWDATTGDAVMGPLKGHTASIKSVAFSPDGTRIVSGSYDNTIRLWDATTGNAVMGPLEGHTENITSVAFSPSGTRIVSGSYDNTIRLWDATTGNAVMEPLKGHTSPITSVAFSPDGTRIVSGSWDKTIRLWDALTGDAVMKPLEGHTHWVTSVAISPDGTRIVSGSNDKTIRLWDATTGNALMEPLEGHTNDITSVAFSSNGTHIVSGSEDQTIRLWDTTTGDAVMESLKGHTKLITSVAFSPDGTHIVSGSHDRTIRLWDATTGNAVMEPLEEHTNAITSVAFSLDGTRIVSGSPDWTIRLWDATTGYAVMEPLKGHIGRITSVAFSPNGARIVSGSNDKTIRIWDTTTGDVVMKSLKGHTEQINSVAFSPDGVYIVSGSEDKTIRLWDATTGDAVMEPLKGHTEVINSVAFSPDGALIVSGSKDKTIRLWDATTGDAVMEPLKGHAGNITSVAFSPDGARIVSGSIDKTIRIWDTTTGDVVMKSLKGHTEPIESVAFSSDGTLIVSGSWDKTIRVWDVTRGDAVIQPLRGHTGSISSIAFSLDGSHIVSGSPPDTIIRSCIPEPT